MSQWETCIRSEMLPVWRDGIVVNHDTLREELMRRDKPPTSFKCARCGKEIMK